MGHGQKGPLPDHVLDRGSSSPILYPNQRIHCSESGFLRAKGAVHTNPISNNWIFYATGEKNFFISFPALLKD